jgi:peroxiredoxin
MRSLFKLLTSAVVVGVLSLSSAFAAEATDFTLPDINGKKVSLSEFQDQVVVMSFWATWCGPCKEEMPHLEKMYKEKKDQGFTVLSISTDDARSVSRVKPHIKKNQFTFPVLLDKESKVITQYNPNKTLPFTVVIAKGEIVKTHQGFNPGDEEELAELVDELLAGEKPVEK